MIRKNIRNYQMSDAFLAERVDSLANSLTTDQTVLAEYGFTMGKVTNLQGLKTAFINVGGDETYMGIMMSARLVRDAAKKALYDEMFKLAQKVETKWPTDLPKKIEFALEGNISQLNSYELLRKARLTTLALTKYLTDMGAPFGITTGYITAFNGKITALDTNNTAFDESVNVRKRKTSERIIAANALYAEMVSLCAIGKNYWESMDNATKYDEYVLTTNQPPANVVVNLTLASNEQQEVVIAGLGANTNLLLENLSNEPVQEWFAELNTDPVPPENAIIDPLSSQNHLAGELNYDTINNKYFVKNIGGMPATVKITAMN